MLKKKRIIKTWNSYYVECIYCKVEKTGVKCSRIHQWLIQSLHFIKLQTFVGNADKNTVVQQFWASISARYIRVHPLKFYGKRGIRVEFIGCQPGEKLILTTGVYWHTLIYKTWREWPDGKYFMSVNIY